jgi:hypothetical protein
MSGDTGAPEAPGTPGAAGVVAASSGPTVALPALALNERAWAIADDVEASAGSCAWPCSGWRAARG